MRVVGELVSASGAKRGSRNAAAMRVLLESSPSGRRASSVPMQPRSSPACVSVTNVAPGSCSTG